MGKLQHVGPHVGMPLLVGMMQEDMLMEHILLVDTWQWDMTEGDNLHLGGKLLVEVQLLHYNLEAVDQMMMTC